MPTGASLPPEAEASTHTPSRAGRVAAIDGLRGLAVAGVVGYHVADAPVGGYLGVDLFFVISGYVITRVLVAEHRAHGRISLRGFWLRRARRILPALGVVLVAVGAWVALGPDSSAGLVQAAGRQTLASLVFATNWWQVLGPVGYWDLAAGQSPLTHLWSLAVEEQFYLAWPVAFLLVVRRVPERGRWLVLAGVAAGSYALAWLLADPGAIARDPGIVDRIYQGTDTRAGALLLGCAAALAPRLRVGPRIGAALAALATAVLGAAWASVAEADPTLFRGWLLATGLAAALLVHLAGAGALGAGERLLAARPLLLVGSISYPLYLWHWPVLVVLERTALGSRPLDLAVSTVGLSTVLAVATYAWVESPVRSRRPGWRPVLVVTLTGAVVVGGVAGWQLAHLPPAPGAAIVTGIDGAGS